MRGSTLFYLQTTSGEGGIQSILRRYDLTRRAPIGGSIDLGAYASCSECPGSSPAQAGTSPPTAAT